MNWGLFAFIKSMGSFVFVFLVGQEFSDEEANGDEGTDDSDDNVGY
jgi:hypothetical protein